MLPPFVDSNVRSFLQSIREIGLYAEDEMLLFPLHSIVVSTGRYKTGELSDDSIAKFSKIIFAFEFEAQVSSSA